VIIVLQLRQSLINQYLFCPKSFQLEHRQNCSPGYRSHAALNGSVVHELLHMVHNGRWNLEPATTYDEVLHQLEFEGPEKLIPVDWNNREVEVGRYRDMAAEIINHYRMKPYNRDTRVILSEAPFTVKVGRVIFTGTVDQIRENPDGSIELLDYKSSQRVPPEVALASSYQLILYSLAMLYGTFHTAHEDVSFMRLPDHATWYHLRNHIPYKRKTTVGDRVFLKGDEKPGDPRHRISITPDMIAAFRKDVGKVARAINEGIFPRIASTANCSLCKFSKACIQDKESDALNNKQMNQLSELIHQIEKEKAA